MYMRALTGREKALGPDHPSTLKSATGLGAVYEDQNKLDEAKQMYVRALSGTEKALGPAHSSTVQVAWNLFRVYQKEGRATDAERLKIKYGL